MNISKLLNTQQASLHKWTYAFIISLMLFKALNFRSKKEKEKPDFLCTSSSLQILKKFQVK